MIGHVRCYTLLIAMLLISCSENEKINTNVKYQVNIDELENLGIGSFSSYFKTVKLVFLETSDKSLIRYIDAMQVTDDYIFILDRRSRALYAFDKSGKFSSKIGERGAGPGEYSDITDFTIDNEAETIYLYDIDKSSIYSYSFNGEFKTSIPLDNKIKGKSAHLQFVRGKLILDYGFFGPPSEKNTPLLVEIDLHSGKVKNKYLSSDKNNVGFQLITFKDGSYFYSRNHGSPYYAPSYSLTVYSLENNVAPFFQLKSSRQLKKDDIQELDLSNPSVIADINNIQKVRSIRSFVEAGEYLICEFLDEYAMRSVVYSKNTGKADLYDYLFDDLFYSSPEQSLYHYLGCADNKGMYTYLNINDMGVFADYYKNGFFKYEFDEEQLARMNSLSEESNPILFYYELK